MTDFNALIREAMTRGRVADIKTHITAALESGIDAGTILNGALISTMEIIGEKFSKNQVFIPEVMMAARAMNEGLAILKPRLIGSGVKPLGKVIICTVKGDSHDIGKNLVKIMLEGVGLEVIDLGSNVPTEKVIETVKATGISIVCLSALLTTTMPNLKLVIEKLKEEGLKDKVKVLVGGAPVTQEYADSIGADGYSPDAAGAARLVKSFLI
jgi:5-methyltetrahydrofolate--homocysteine methyltransferase